MFANDSSDLIAAILRRSDLMTMFIRIVMQSSKIVR